MTKTNHQLSPADRDRLEEESLDLILIQTHQLQKDLAEAIDSPFTVPQRINALKAVATIYAIYTKLRALQKKGTNEQPGSAVRHFEQAFSAASSPRRGEGNAGSDADELELEDHLAELELGDADSDDAREH